MTGQVQDRPADTGPDRPVRHASYLALGSLAGRVLGLCREIAITRLFGQTGLVSAFTLASQIPIMLHDLLVGGYVSAAFIPVLAAHHERDRDTDYRHLISALLFVFGLGLALVSTLLWLLAAPLARWMAGGFQNYAPELVDLAAQLVRMMVPVLWLTGMAGVLNAVLYAMRRFAWPAVANAIFNAGIVVAAPLLAPRLGIMAAVVGLWAGIFLQAVLLATDLRRAGLALRGYLWHPGLRDIFVRYLPLMAGLALAQFQIFADRRLASGTGVSGIAWMRTGTTLQQLPLGLITISAGLATLPGLSRTFERGEMESYRTRVIQGLVYVSLLMVPVLLLMGVLAEPVIRILFLRGQFALQDVEAVLPATRIYLAGAFAAALDHLLNNAFYARRNTLLPSLVGIGSICLYFLAALPLVSPLGYLGLVWADTVKQMGHMLIMWLLASHYGFGHWTRLWRELGPFLGRIGLAGGLAAAGTFWLWHTLSGLVATSFWSDLGLVAFCGSLGLVLYGAGLHMLREPALPAVLLHLRTALAGIWPQNREA